MVRKRAPDRGDIVFLDFNPVRGREQAGRRPAVVLSSHEYNAKTGLAVMCLITSKSKRYPFEIQLPSDMRTTGVILADHVRNVDWQDRDMKLVDRVPIGTLHEVLSKLHVLIG